MRTTLQQDADSARLSLRGDLGDDCEIELLEIRSKLKVKRVHIDCERLGRLNSFGVARWSSFIRELESSGVRFSFSRCPVNFVEYCNMTPCLIGAGSVESLFMPYHCEECRHNEDVLIVLPAQPKDPPCPKCASIMAPQVDPEDHLMFLGHQS